MLRNYRVECEDIWKLMEKTDTENRFLAIVAVRPNLGEK